eukprot:TRINITY_DN79325_c0_g1_i1.p1 TRINITY_DN79325_c0_g1~~TRINITY_DN79325_c0_g1_i1.p1  ORF type:complete len:422 (-),score=102.62 TRINITY_DN79325_c0_g1_i1:125-1390(-)
MAAKHVDEGDLETQPLLKEEAPIDEDEDDMSYDARKLVTFQVLSELKGTVWTKATLWKQMGLLLCVSLVTSIWVTLAVRDPAQLDVSKFQKIAGFLKVVVGLLLSFFLSSSVTRWYNCTNGFLELFDAIRGLQMMLSALGVPRERVHLCLRYAVLSARVLHIDLQCKAMSKADQEVYLKKSWDSLTATKVDWVSNESFAKVYPKERAKLEPCWDSSGMVWIWVTSLITRMSQDGEIPPMPTPTYGKIIAIAEAAYKGIRMVRASINVQPPYVYVQMMAILVASNNIICAVSFGMTIGVSLGTILAYLKMNPMTDKAVSGDVVSAALQDLGISFMISTIGPFLYQALLEVCVCIAQPFAGAGEPGASTAGRIPTDKLLCQLEKDLRDAERMTERLPCWDQPYFKQPAAPAAPAPAAPAAARQ